MKRAAIELRAIVALAFVVLAWSDAGVARAQCTYEVIGDGLYRGVLQQRLDLTSADSVCAQTLCDARALSFEAENLSGFVVTSKTTTTCASAIVELQLRDIPSTLPAVSEWTVHAIKADGTSEQIGSVKLRAFDGPSVVAGDDSSPSLYVSYRDRGVDSIHSGKGTSGLAVVTQGHVIEPDGDGEPVAKMESTPGLTVENTARIAARSLLTPADPPSCETAAQKGQPECADAIAACKTFTLPACENPSSPKCIEAQDLCVAAEILAQRSRWRVSALSWKSTVYFSEAGTEDDEYWVLGSTRLEDLTRVTFATNARHTDPLRVRVDLLEPWKAVGSERKVLYSTELTLAEGARIESLPLPIRDHLFVACGEGAASNVWDPALPGNGTIDTAFEASTRAVDDDAIEGGSCFLHYSPDIGPQPEHGFKLYGPQDIVITVARDGATDASRRWLLQDLTKHAHLALPTLEDGSDGTGPYRVRAVLNGAQSPDVKYRPPAATTSSTVSTAAATDGELEFAAKLRPRGATGWRSLPIRTFVTFPIEFVGFRLPARPSELHASSESTTIQTTTPRAGAMLAVEPWDYDTGRNPLTIPMRFMTGMHIFDLAHGSLAPSLVTGVSLTFPILDLPGGTVNNQLGTDVAVGLFWEVDLQEPHPFKDGNRFVLTLGINAGSLFGAK